MGFYFYWVVVKMGESKLKKLQKYFKLGSTIGGALIVGAQLMRYYDNSKEKSIKNAIVNYIKNEIYEDEIKPVGDLIKRLGIENNIQKSLEKELSPHLILKFENLSFMDYLKFKFGDQETKKKIVRKYIKNNREDITKESQEILQQEIRKAELKYLKDLEDELKEICEKQSGIEDFIHYNEILTEKVWTPKYWGLKKEEVRNFVKKAVSEYETKNCFDQKGTKNEKYINE